MYHLLDDIIFNQTPEEHITRFNAAFGQLKETGLKLKPSKCELLEKKQTIM